MDSWGHPKRSLGQNFLCDAGVVRCIADAIGATYGNTVVEIGPGRGALTRELAVRGARVLAVEKDRELAWRLHADLPDIGMVYADALRLAWEGVSRLPGVRVVGNLPYNIASPLMWELVARVRGWERMVFLVQKEVGERLVADPRTPHYGALGVWVQSWCQPELVRIVPPHVFRPRPKVDSAIVRFWPRDDIPRAAASLARLLHVTFQKRRKQLGTILRPWWGQELDAWCAQHGVERTARPEELSPGQFVSLAEIMLSLWNTGKSA
ncbi:16S rRNA (adenine(1518)-N(6)/adenine(1519)-N(6)) - dimethyltransferase [Thermodesulfomicrobium sp. WS]|uniref:16S rRNA (adenine(1518)-N(6)/adenine(1519)-N(6))- dimethyltransferase RsmA n=1 Tax=Thermodesulfomicrobium sp. WS TaxID=3004129 RepID=UPI0024935669|nr:16S rRNA (adenine(1518)-N(6)/adenine(1519)-N(6))-dimethyltransferase RsmA [Thermodesulfomicrobium sp. WS]BDV01169.1 16S rRNA (adenine(1518)-N(6)/adenine(1519)-N(6)) - dimethyltransferase [Thermodesulfomicrobium sp. WS]